MDKVYFALSVLSAVLTGLVGVLHVIAPATATDKDNKLLNGLRYVQDKILAVLLPKSLR